MIIFFSLIWSLISMTILNISVQRLKPMIIYIKSYIKTRNYQIAQIQWYSTSSKVYLKLLYI